MKYISSLFFCLCFANSLSAQDAAEFSPAYIKEVTNTVRYEIPEVQELVHIIFCLTEFGQNSDEIINRETNYYNTVMEYFRPYEKTKIVAKINKQLKKDRYDELKMDAVGFYFEGKSIKKDPKYEQLSGEGKNSIAAYVSDFEVFAEITNFRKFFQEQQAVYAKAINLMNEQLIVKKHWEWLEKRFDNRYDSYRITFSPLVGDMHAMNDFQQEDFKQVMLFIGPAYDLQKYGDRYSADQLEGLMGRVTFTKMDQNYLNPLSEQFRQDIEVLFGEVSVWNNGTSGYNSPMATFNEYMAHGLYSLFVMDYYEEDAADFILDKHEALMKRRGFIKYGSFNALLMEVYAANKTVSASELYKQFFIKMVRG